MHHATLCYVFDKTNPNDIKVLLGMKKRGFGEGQINGYGGKQESGESFEECAIREVYDEAKIKVWNLEKVAELDFKFTNAPPGKDWDQIVHVYFTNNWSGNPRETDEMTPLWYSKKELLKVEEKDYKNFWPNDRHWLPEVLKEKKIYGWIVFGKDNKSTLSIKLEETTNFNR
jgi:ADP-ribose pyrophosphatase YjhB (NUDIX family)